MSVKLLPEGGWLVDVRPQGRNGKRIRKKFTTKSEAQQYERWIIGKLHNKEWLPTFHDKKTFSELIDLWWKYHGQTLKDGVRAYSKLKHINCYMKNPLSTDITPAFLSEYRASRLSDGIKPKTINNDQMLISGVFTTLISLGHYSGKNPLTGLKKIKVIKREMGFFDKVDIDKLLNIFVGQNLLAVKLCLATGARWGEIERLEKQNVTKYKVTFNNTKNGEHRTVPISTDMYSELMETEGRQIVFENIKYWEIRKLINDNFPHLPCGQSVHALRHTFASHFMMNGGNILTLRNILGHSNIQQTMVYAHFSPSYLLDVIKLNPLAMR